MREALMAGLKIGYSSSPMKAIVPTYAASRLVLLELAKAVGLAKAIAL